MFLVLSKEFELKKVHGRNLQIVRDFLYQQSKIRLHRSSTWTANKPNCLANDPFCAWQWIREFLAYPLKQNTETISIVHYLWIVIKRTCSCWQRWSTEVEWWFTSRIRVLPASHISLHQSRWTARSVSKASSFFNKPWTAAMLSPKSSTESNCCFSLMEASSSSTLAKNCWYVNDSSSIVPRVAAISFSLSHACKHK